MAKKSKIFSQLALAALAICVLGLAGNISRAHACAGDSSDDPETATDCVEASAEGDSSLLVESNASSDDVIELDVEKYDAYFTADDEVSSSRALPHSIFLAGNSVSSADSVEGVSFLAGNLVTLDGSAEYVAAAGSSVKINGRVENDLFVAGNTIELGEDASIGRDVFSAGNIFTVRSNLNGNVFFAGNRLVLENVTINGNLNADASEIVIKGKSAISGNFSHSASAKITGLEELSVEGGTSTFASASTAPVFSMSKVTNFLFSLLGQILVTLAGLFFLPEFGKKLLDSFRLKTSWKYLALGLVLIVCLPLALIFLAFTFVGLPLALVGLGLYLMAILFSTSVVGGLIGDKLLALLSKDSKPSAKSKKLNEKALRLDLFKKYSLGITILELVILLPVVGGLVAAISVCFGFGYLVRWAIKR